MDKTLLMAAATGALLLTGACAGRNADRDVTNSNTPDEFRVVTKAPLTVPPEYGLRPPAPGASIPAEVSVDRSERVEAFGSPSIGADASAAERALVAMAGANAVNPVVRAQVDYEETKTIRRSRTLTDRVLGWTGSEEELEAAAVDSATGGADVVIEQSNTGSRIKLPGT
ncbi:MAG: DUF3035 domain-containing protein [Pseudomonadota bacterium]